MAKMPKIGPTREGSASAELAGELTVTDHQVTVIIYGPDGNATYTGSFSPTIGLPGEWSAT